MVENNPPAPADRSRARVIPLPVALYVSDELIFELYDGGQPYVDFRSSGKGSFRGRKASQRRPNRVPQMDCAHTKTSARVPQPA
jgi:hypothetical protein